MAIYKIFFNYDSMDFIKILQNPWNQINNKGNIKAIVNQINQTINEFSIQDNINQICLKSSMALTPYWNGVGASLQSLILNHIWISKKYIT